MSWSLHDRLLKANTRLYMTTNDCHVTELNIAIYTGEYTLCTLKWLL